MSHAYRPKRTPMKAFNAFWSDHLKAGGNPGTVEELEYNV